ncbi:T9SS type A sorting domain-containing protein [Flavobacterium sp.]|uniref:T9SS type A sorting domain-containing protein n=1 Tax=Flavobacterium sp. TaxID=239 RepID=UPI0026399121|nr:T9SS type A sorting domain-containing protein [Flavobacterium sp.]
MKRKITILAVMFLGIQYLQSQNITQTELLGRPTDSSITIQAFFDADVDVAIQYGTSSGNYSNQTDWTNVIAGNPAEIVLTGLSPNTKYFYRMLYRLPNATTFITRPEYTFQTQRVIGSSYKYVVQADPHMDEQSNIPLYQLCLQNQLEEHPDFMIDLGDFLMTDKLKNLTTNTVPHDTIPYRCRLLRSNYERLCHSVPLFIALGNHEGEAGWNLNGTANNIAVWDTQERQKYFLNPAPDGDFYTGDTTVHAFVGLRENYYSWQWGDALYIVLDPYWYTNPKPTATTGWRWTLGQAQYNWLKNTLATSTATFKFVFSHQIIGGDPDGRGGVEFADLYEWGGNNSDGTYGFTTNRPGWDMPIKDLLTQNHVNIFFHGHDHFFGKQEKDCLIYQETPQPSHPNFNGVTYATDYGYLEGQILPNSGHIRVTVNPDGVLVEYVRAYLPASENATRHNKDVSASYFIGTNNCYTLGTNNPTMIWNANYADEIVYPNPFSKETAIEFEVQNSENISISIFNQNGQLVKDIVHGNYLNNGKFQVIWDGTDNSGSDASDGVYIYKIIKDNGKGHSGKLILKRH